MNQLKEKFNRLMPIIGPNSKPALQQIFETVNGASRLVISPLDYKMYGFYQRGIDEKYASKYLCGYRGTEVKNILNPDPDILQDKLKFDKHFGDLGLSVPPILGIYGSDYISSSRPKMRTAPEVASFLRRLMGQDRQIVIKQYAGMQGSGVMVIAGWQVKAGEDHAIFSNSEYKSVEDIARILAESGTTWIIQERLQQHDILDHLNSSSLNTIRIVTFLRRDGSVEFPIAIQRIGRTNSQIDAHVDGGIAVVVDPKNGQLAATGNLKSIHSLNSLNRHPDSGVYFSDIKIPDWQKVRSIVGEFARNAGANRFVGWDVVITPEGPVVVEGNHDWDSALSQMYQGGILTDDLTEILQKEANLDIDNDRLPPH